MTKLAVVLIFTALFLMFIIVTIASVKVVRRGQVAVQNQLVDLRQLTEKISLSQDSVLTVEQQLVALLSVAPDAAMTFNGRSGRVTYANTAAYDLFGFGSELLEMTVEQLMPERYRSRHLVHRSGFMAAPRSRPMGAFLKIYILTRKKDEIRVNIGLNNYGTNSVVAWIKPIPLEALMEIDHEYGTGLGS